jgi:hypothetical protein
MGRFGFTGFGLSVALIIFLVGGLAGCGNSSPVTTTSFAVPASVTLAPNPNASLEVGTYQAFLGAALTSTKTPIAEPVSYLSSNTAVLTVANNGLACAGSWNSLSNPQVCTPGRVGVAVVTASAQGVSSPSTTVYVHQHIDKVTVSLFVPPNTPPPANPCYSVNQTAIYQANAFSRGVDITPTVGVFNWQTLVPTVASLNTSAAGLTQGQVQVTAKVPGLAPLFATIGNATSVPLNFSACLVQSITLAVTSSTSTSRTITPTVIDTLGTTITGIPLTWSSSQPASVSVSTVGGASGSTAGSATIIASCTPPTCNTGVFPSIPIYPANVVNMTISPTGSPQNATVYVSTTECGNTDECFSTVVPVTAPNTVGNFITLPATPDSLAFDRQGAKIYMGTDSGRLGTVGLAVIDAASNTATQFVSLPGKVLAVSPDGNKVIISDTSPEDAPNHVFVLNTVTNAVSTFQITGATAADFSPDSLKAYILAGSNLYVFSTVDGLQTISLAAPASDVSFLSEGAFAYVAGGASSAVSVFRTCDNGRADTVTAPAIPTFIKTLPGPAKLFSSDSPETYHLLTVDPPGVGVISVNTTPSGCAPTVVDSPVVPFNLGQGNFVPKQLILSQDGSTAYVLTSNLNSILVFNIPGQTASAIALLGNATPLSASLTPDGTQLWVGASDGTVHVVSTVAGGDIRQIPFPQGLCQNSVGQPFPTRCNPDLIAVKP